MVAPTPIINFGVDFRPLIKQIEADLAALPQKTDLAALPQKTDLAALPQKTDLAALPQKTDLAALPQRTDLAALPQKSDLAALATKDDIRRLKCLIEKHWFAKQTIEYVSSGQVRGAYALLSHRLQLQDPERRASLTFADLQREADFLQMRDSLPDDYEEGEELVRHLKALFEHMPSQPQSPSKRR